MSNDKDKKTTAPDFGEGIPVRELRFSRPNGIETPVDGNHVSKIMSNARAPEQTRQWNALVAITYYPRIRHHQVQVTRGTGDAEFRMTFYLHESWCSWVAG